MKRLEEQRGHPPSAHGSAPGPSLYVLPTKLHRPPVPVDFVPREGLRVRLETGRRYPLTLVSAPAGYGKTTLAAEWLASLEKPSAWISLDEADGDLEVFLNYLVAAVQKLFPDSCGGVTEALREDELPPTPRLAARLLADLDAVEEQIVVALDDFHLIRDPNVHELLELLLRHPPRNFHLVILTRRDPPLPLASLRADGRMTEVRLQDLEFTQEETAAFLAAAVHASLESKVVSSLHDSTEGWPVGLRLASLALRGRSDVDEVVRGLASGSRRVEEYLLAEVLDGLDEEVRDLLRKASILDRLCAGLCESLWGPSRTSGGGTTGESFLRLLDGAGLLAVALDDRQEWYRFHPLFRELLHRELVAVSPDEIPELHRCAAGWLDRCGLMEEAIRHALLAGDPVAASRVVSRHRERLVDREQWHRLSHLLTLLPAGIIEVDSELLMLQAWIWDNRGRFQQVAHLLDRVDALLDEGTLGATKAQTLRSEAAVLRSLDHYRRGEGDLALESARQAVDGLPRERLSERGYGVLMLAAALQMTGDLTSAYREIHERLAREAEASATYHGRLLLGLCYVQWTAADLTALAKTSRTVLSLGLERELPESVVHARYFQGVVQYQTNQLEAAEESVLPEVSGRVTQRFETHLWCTFVLAMVHQARRRPEQARELANRVVESLLESGNTSYLPIAQAFEADLALRQGRLAEALRWTETYEVAETPIGYRPFVPELIVARVLLAEGSAGALDRADRLLDSFRRFFASRHNTRFLIETQLLQVLLREAQGELGGALELLEQTVALAQPGGFIRVFLDLGAGLAPLLGRLRLDDEALRYVGRILAAFGEDRQESSSGRSGATIDVGDSAALLDPLTARQREILEYLASPLSNKEIASRLHISPGTVKRHTHDIYEKLGVSDRRAAVAKAAGLGYL